MACQNVCNAKGVLAANIGLLLWLSALLLKNDWDYRLCMGERLVPSVFTLSVSLMHIHHGGRGLLSSYQWLAMLNTVYIHMYQIFLCLSSSLCPPPFLSILFFFFHLISLFSPSVPLPLSLSLILPTPGCGETDKKLIYHPIKCRHWNIASKKPSFSPCANWPSISMCMC